MGVNQWSKYYFLTLREKARREAKEAEFDPDKIALAHAAFVEEAKARRAGKLPDYVPGENHPWRRFQRS